MVAQALGGVRVERDSRDPLRRRLFNVVEEMAIASGVPLPEVYVLEHEAGINAFAAGHRPANAAVAVTRGALEKLNRAELQGVIAHEFGHILNGDMRLNTRLIGLVFGLMVVALIGRTILRYGPRRSRKGGALLALAAFVVMVLGYLGVFLGRILQAAVSRHRESLADASAVQFTRDPLGLKGALVKIGAFGLGSRLSSPQVDEVAHLLFAPGMARLFATHPPLVSRIKALDPGFHERDFAAVRMDAQPDPPGTLPAGVREEVKLTPQTVARMVGTFGTAHVLAAQSLLGSLPADVIGQSGGATGLLLALALDSENEVRGRQLRLIGESLGAQTREQTEAALDVTSGLVRPQRLVLLNELQPELRKLPESERRSLLACLNRLVRFDGGIDIFEYALATLARVHLTDDLKPLGERRATSFHQALVELQALFSTLARHGTDNEDDARQAYEAGMQHLLPYRRPPYKPIAGWPAAMDRALKCLDRLHPQDKSKLIEALVMTISHDRTLTVEEAELLRAICAALHCPLPPFVQ